MIDQIVEIVPGRLYRLGDNVEVDGRISWVSLGANGFEPINSYLLLEDHAALLVDTGVACHEERIVQQLRRLLPRDAALSVFLTRLESDCLGNLGAISTNVPVSRVYAGGVSNPFDYFEDINSAEMMRHSYAMELERKRPGEEILLSDSRTLKVLRPPLRLLSTSWLYDEATHTLFTSDSFGHSQVEYATDKPLLDSAEREDFDAARAHLFTKFDWLLASKTDEIRRRLSATFEDRTIDVIAPTHGCVLKGRTLVRRHYEMVARALDVRS